MKELTLDEISLLEEMKSNCLKKGQYIDDKAKDKFKMLCHLEDFSIAYYELLEEKGKEIKRLKEENKEIEKLKRLFRWVVIKPNQFNSGYELFNTSRQELYAFYIIRCDLLNIKFGKEAKNLYFDSFMVEEGKDYE